MSFRNYIPLLILGTLSLSASLQAKPHSKGLVAVPAPTPGASQSNGDASQSSLPGGAAQKNRPKAGPPRATKKKGAGDSSFLVTSEGCDQKHSIENFVQIGSATNPQPAPKGTLYFTSDLREVPQLYHLKAPKTWPEQLTFFANGVVYYAASPSGHKVLVASHVGGDEQYDIYLLDGISKKMLPLLVDRTVRIDSVAWNPKEDGFVFTSNQRNKIDFDLYRYDLAQKKQELLSELSGQNSVTDVSPDGNWIAVTQYRSVVDSDVLLWNHTEKKIRRVRPAQKQWVVALGKFSANSQALLFISDAEAGMPQLHRAKLAQLEQHQQLSAGPWGVESFSLNADRTQVVFAFNEDGYSRLEAFGLGPAAERKAPVLVPDLGESVSSGFSFRKTPAGSIFLANTSSTTTSDIWEIKGPTKTQWTYSTGGQIRPECMVKAELIHYPSFDGLEVPAFLFRPIDAPRTGPIPFVIHLHGGPESQYRPTFSKIFQYFLQRGFGVLSPNVRGSTGYGRQYNLLDNYKKRMDSVRDAEYGARWLVDKNHSSKGIITIYGGSYGGFMVLRTIQVSPDYFAAASESVGISDFVTFLKNTMPYRRSLREAEYGPLSDEEFLKSISPMTYLDRIKTPLLIFHGANDPRVPVSETEQIVAALKKREVTVDAKIFANEGHGNARLSNIMEQARLMAHFFDHHVQKNLNEKRKAP